MDSLIFNEDASSIASTASTKLGNFHPLVLATFMLVGVSHLGAGGMSPLCLHAIAAFALVYGFMFNFQQVDLPESVLSSPISLISTFLPLVKYVMEISFIAVAGIHFPMMPRRVTLAIVYMLGNTLLESSAFAETWRFFFFIIALIAAIRRVFLLVLTLTATSAPTLLFIPLSYLMPEYSFNDHDFFRADECPEEVAIKREASFTQLLRHWNAAYPQSLEISSFLSQSFSDLRFTASNRVFLPFKKKLDGWCDPCTVVREAAGVDLIDVDNHRLLDVSGSYGVNVCGTDMYKKFITQGWEMTKNTGLVLGPVHHLLPETIAMLKKISKKDEVSFHMSGTEAVMSATRLARFNTKRKLIVVFAGSYHGWWDGVQPLAGNERTPTDVLTLMDMSPRSLTVIKMRWREIAAVLVNPLQAFHPNAPPPSDLVLASNTRQVSDSTKEYARWLVSLRQVCADRGIVFMFDEVYTGFRLAPGGAQEYFGVQADMVVYGKTLGGGLPIGVVCGPHHLMSRSDPSSPLRVAYVIGTFAAHPVIVGAMNAFLKWVESDEARAGYDRLRSDVATWTRETNQIFHEQWGGNPPIEVHSYSSVWTIIYKRPGRYHFLLQYYLKDEGLNLSWVGTGRLSFSIDFTMNDLTRLREKLIKACRRMEQDGWWYNAANYPKASASDSHIKLLLGKEAMRAVIKKFTGC